MDIGLSKNLKLNQLRLIALIAEYGQLNIAADELAITQPAASRMLSDIESTLGSKLFIRHAKGMEPTLVGQAICRRAHNFVVELRDLSREVEELKQGNGGSTAVGAVTGAAVGFVIPAIQQLRAVAPRAEIDINVDTSENLVRDLVTGNNDFVVSRLPSHYNSSDFDVLPARTETVKILVREGHPLAGISDITMRDLSKFEWVMQSHRAPIREAIEEAFVNEQAQFPLTITNSTSLLALIAILVSSNSVAPLASEVADLLMSDTVGTKLVTLRMRQTIELSPYFLLKLKGRHLSPLAHQLERLIKAELIKR